MDTVTVKDVVENIAIWSERKDAGVCRLVYAGNYVDSLGYSHGRYYIEAGGIVNEPVAVDGDTVLSIEWKEPTDAGRALVASQDAEPAVTAFPITDTGTVSVPIKDYHDLERRIAALEAQAIKDARTIEGLSAQIVHAQMELAAALGHEEADYHANLGDLANEVAQLRQQLAEALAALGTIRRWAIELQSTKNLGEIYDGLDDIILEVDEQNKQAGESGEAG